MPRLNRRGDIVAGVAGGTVSINGRVVATNAGQSDWLDDDRAIFQIGASLFTCTVDGEPVLLDALGANELEADGGVYAARVDGVVRVSNDPTPYPGAFVGDVAPDGSVLLLGPDGRIDGVWVNGLQALGGRTWSALDGGTYRPVQSPGVPWIVPVAGKIYGLRRAGGFCCYLAESGSRFIVQHLDRPVGVVLAVTNGAFRPDLRVLDDGQLKVCYATTAGEAPGDVRSFPVDPRTFATLDGGPVIIVPPPPPPDPPPPDPEPEEPKAMYPFQDPKTGEPAVDVPSILRGVRAQFPTPLGERHAEFLVACCQAVGYGAGLLNKNGGTMIRLSDGRTVSQDYMCFPNLAVKDFLINGEGTAEITWGEAEQGNPGQYCDVRNLFGSVEPGGGGPTDPPTDPPVDADGLDELRLEVAAQGVRLDAQDARLDEGDAAQRGSALKGGGVTSHVGKLKIDGTIDKP